MQASDDGGLNSGMTVVRMVAVLLHSVAITKYQCFCFYKMKLLIAERLSTK